MVASEVACMLSLSMEAETRLIPEVVMFDAPLHPKLVHLPLALAVLMPAVTLGLLVAWWREWLPGRTWWIAVALQMALFGSGWLAYETGEQDEEAVEEVLASEAPLERHEELAEQFFWASAGASVLMLLPMVVSGARRRKWLAVVATASTVVVLVVGYRVGEAGGALVYEHGAAAAHAAPPGAPGGAEADTPDDEE